MIVASFHQTIATLQYARLIIYVHTGDYIILRCCGHRGKPAVRHVLLVCLMKARYLACISYVINTHSIHTIAATLHHFATDWGPPWIFWIISSLSWRSYVFNTVAEFVSTVTVRIQLLFLSLFCWTCFFCRPQWIRFIFSIAFQRTMIARGKFWYMQKIKDLLQKNEIPTFIAEPMPGKDIVEITKVRIL